MARNLGRILVVGLLGFFLLVSLVAANAVVGVERTALDGEFVEESLEEEGAYEVALEEMESELATDAAGEPEGGDAAAVESSPDELLAASVTEEYLQEQTERNIDRLYAYLHGEREDLYVAVDVEPLKGEVASEIASDVVESMDVSEFDPRFAGMTESQSQFQAAREEFEAEQKQRIQEETDRELSDRELEAAYDQARGEIRAEAITRIEEEVAAGEYPGPVADAAVELGTVYVDGLVQPDATYEEFLGDVEDAEANLIAAAETAAERQLDEEIPDTVELTDELTAEDREQLETVREGVSLLDNLAIALPILAVVLALLVGRATATRSGGLFVVGSTSALAGGVGVGGLTLLQGTVEVEFDSIAAQEGLSPGLADLLLGLFDRVVGVFIGQSWVLLGLGLVLVVAGFGTRAGWLPIADRPGKDDGGIDDVGPVGRGETTETGKTGGTDGQADGGTGDDGSIGAEGHEPDDAGGATAETGEADEESDVVAETTETGGDDDGDEGDGRPGTDTEPERVERP
ncbi:MAG: hypothetical protein V5A46_09105 [Haloferacaceae archaeon]